MQRLKSIGSASLLLAVSFLCLQAVSEAHVQFADTDVRTFENNNIAQATLRVDGGSGVDVVLVQPMTAAQYRGQRSHYGGSCDSIVAAADIMDQAEEIDFHQDPIVVLIPHNSTNEATQEYSVRVPIINDNVHEPTEYFLLVIDREQSGGGSQDTSDSGGAHGLCLRVDIIDDDEFDVELQSVSSEVNEDAGTVEVIQVVKMGQTEQSVTVTFNVVPDPSGAFSGIPHQLTLDKDTNSSTIAVTVIDDPFPEDNETFSIGGSFEFASNQQYRDLHNSISLTILDNDYAEVGFEASEFTVVEGERAFLKIVLKNSELNPHDYKRWQSAFTATIGRGHGNATEQEHYRRIPKINCYPSDIVQIPTTDDSKLERSRWLEVRLIEERPHPLNSLQMSVARLIIRDNDGTPNKPTIEKVTLEDGAATLSWTIANHELRPVQRYTLTLQPTESGEATVVYNKPIRQSRAASSQEKEEKKVRRLNLTNINDLCKFDEQSKSDKCEFKLQENAQLGDVYNITLCAINEFGVSCDNERKTVVEKLPTSSAAGGLSESDKNDDDNSDAFYKSILWMIVGFLVAILLGCSLLVCLALYSAIAALMRKKKGRKQMHIRADSDRIKLDISPSVISFASAVDV